MPVWVWEKYLSNLTVNKSQHIIEMYIKGIEAEMEQFKNQETTIIELMRKLREQETLIANQARELAIVKSRVITQQERETKAEARRKEADARRKEKEAKKQEKEAYEEKYNRARRINKGLQAAEYLLHTGEPEFYKQFDDNLLEPETKEDKKENDKER